MEENEERLTKLFWELEIKKLNESLPKFRKPISLLLSEEDPHYITITNEKISFNKKEIEEFSSFASKDELKSIFLPIVIVKEWESKKGTYKILGNKLEIKLINKILERPEDAEYIYLPEIIELFKRFPSLFVLGYRFSL
ncbi:MAG: DUF61 family protein [Candidatus Verstraetearchaeota archaeon]|nr:DUF61 family protein [Candidatus Verstraetearchaeota archaeon]